MLQLDSEPELKEVRIDQGILDLAVRDLRNEFAASLGENRYAILTKTYHDGAPENTVDPEFLLLLHGLYVLEYKNGELW